MQNFQNPATYSSFSARVWVVCKFSEKSGRGGGATLKYFYQQFYIILIILKNKQIIKFNRKQKYDVSMYMQNRNINIEQQMKVLKQLEYLEQQQKKSNAQGLSVLQELPQKISDEIFQDYYGTILKESKFYKEAGYSQEIIKNLVPKMKEITLGPGYIIQKQGYECDKCYFLMDGVLQMIAESKNKNYDSKQIIELHGRQELGFKEFYTKDRVNHTVQTLSISRLVYIENEDLIQILRQLPIDFEIYANIKDTMIFNKTRLPGKCKHCKSFIHSTKNCCQVHLNLNNQLIISKNLRGSQDNRLKYYRRIQDRREVSYNSMYLRKQVRYLIMQIRTDYLTKIYQEEIKFDLEDNDFYFFKSMPKIIILPEGELGVADQTDSDENMFFDEQEDDYDYDEGENNYCDNYYYDDEDDEYDDQYDYNTVRTLNTQNTNKSQKQILVNKDQIFKQNCHTQNSFESDCETPSMYKNSYNRKNSMTSRKNSMASRKNSVQSRKNSNFYQEINQPRSRLQSQNIKKSKYDEKEEEKDLVSFQPTIISQTAQSGIPLQNEDYDYHVMVNQQNNGNTLQVHRNNMNNIGVNHNNQEIKQVKKQVNQISTDNKHILRKIKDVSLQLFTVLNQQQQIAQNSINNNNSTNNNITNLSNLNGTNYNNNNNNILKQDNLTQFSHYKSLKSFQSQGTGFQTQQSQGTSIFKKQQYSTIKQNSTLTLNFQSTQPNLTQVQYSIVRKNGNEFFISFDKQKNFRIYCVKGNCENIIEKLNRKQEMKRLENLIKYQKNSSNLISPLKSPKKINQKLLQKIEAQQI